MGTQERREREKEKRRQQILNAAKELFITKGLSLTTIDDIAKKAELSQGTIYVYFKNKLELYGALNLRTLQSIYDEIKKLSDTKKLGPKEKLLEFKNIFYRAFQHNPLILIILRNTLQLQLDDKRPTSEMLDQINIMIKKTMRLVAKTFEEGVRQGVFRKQNSMAVADSIWCMFMGVLLYEPAKTKLNPKKDFFKSTLDTVFENFYRGIMKT